MTLEKATVQYWRERNFQKLGFKYVVSILEPRLVEIGASLLCRLKLEVTSGTGKLQCPRSTSPCVPFFEMFE